MATNVTWNGVTYSIPAAGELNWAALSNFLIALGNGAAVAQEMKQAVRVATTTPVTVAATTDFAVVSDLAVAGAVAVTLPAGADGQIFVIGDNKGDANTNNITITPNGAETINGAATLVLNHAKQMVMIQYSLATTNWVVLSNCLKPGTIATGDISGQIAIAQGGTGQATANAALNALLPSQGGNSGEALTTNGTDTAWAPVLTNPMTTRGDMIRAGAAGVPERFAAVTDNRVVAGDGTDVVLKQIDDPAFFTAGSNATSSASGTIPTYVKNTFTPSITGGTFAGGTTVARYVKVGSLCHIDMTCLSFSTNSSSTLSFTLPFQAKTAVKMPYFCISNGGTTQIGRFDLTASSSTADLAVSVSSTPFPTSGAVSNNSIWLSFSYEVNE
jgi:hypothetical protein